MNSILFFTVIVLANIIQGITGFAGTILAMPASILLVGYPVAKPVLNVLGLLSGVYVFLGYKKYVNWAEFAKIVIFMAIGIFLGICLKQRFIGKEYILYKALGVFVSFIAVQGLIKLLCTNTNNAKNEKKDVLSFFLLPLAGIVHGIFVSGGPLLIGYLTKRIKDKTVFRSTISTVWIVMNSIVLVDDIRNNFFSKGLCVTILIAVPLLFLGMMIGTILYKKMSQHLFMLITYVLLLISGGMLLIK